MENAKKKLDNNPGCRLLSAVPYLHKNGKVADIGTDHAYLPIYLLREEISKSALACDINEGPIERAREHIASAGLSDRIDTLRTDGLHGVEEYSPDDILIFGMGGELIVKILSEAPWTKNSNIGLVLQPMSKTEVLRNWLNQNGFSILDETLSYEDQYYQTIHAVWSGKSEAFSEPELLLGKKILYENSTLLCGLLRQKIGVFEKIVAGKSQSQGANVSYEMRMIAALQKRLAEAEEMLNDSQRVV